MPFAIGRPGLREAIVGDVVRFDAERLLNDLGGPVAIVGVDRLFEKVSTVSLSPGALIVSSPNPSSAPRFTAGAAGFLILSSH